MKLSRRVGDKGHLLATVGRLPYLLGKLWLAISYGLKTKTNAASSKTPDARAVKVHLAARFNLRRAVSISVTRRLAASTENGSVDGLNIPPRKIGYKNSDELYCGTCRRMFSYRHDTVAGLCFLLSRIAIRGTVGIFNPCIWRDHISSFDNCSPGQSFNLDISRISSVTACGGPL